MIINWPFQSLCLLPEVEIKKHYMQCFRRCKTLCFRKRKKWVVLYCCFFLLFYSARSGQGGTWRCGSACCGHWGTQQPQQCDRGWQSWATEHWRKHTTPSIAECNSGSRQSTCKCSRPPQGPANGRKRLYNAGLDRIVQLLEDESNHAGKLRKAELKMSKQALPSAEAVHRSPTGDEWHHGAVFRE